MMMDVNLNMVSDKASVNTIIGRLNLSFSIATAIPNKTLKMTI